MSHPSVSLLTIIAIVFLLSKNCISAPHPCCPGSQKVVSLMSNYVGTFAHSFSNSSLCSDAQNVAAELKGQLFGCPNDGDRTLLADIEASLPTHSADDECAHSLGFVRAMFAIAASSSSHASDDNEWQALSARFGQQVNEIDWKCAEFGISIVKVPVISPKGDHSQQNVPDTNSVISMPGLTGSHKDKECINEMILGFIFEFFPTINC